MPRVLKRCPWAYLHPSLEHYHDQEWGRPQYNSLRLFELLCLETQQAGLSWLTVLRKREAYRDCFYHFNPARIAQLGEVELEALLKDSRLIRNRRKIQSILTNARSFQKIQEKISFSDFVWRVMEGKPLTNYWKAMEEVPTYTDLAIQLTLSLKEAGFQMIGPTTVYSFMQAAGMVNDHLIICHCHPNIDIPKYS